MIKRLRSRRLEVERRWLEESDDGAGVGFDPTGWERATWILHAMYESIDGADTQTYDEAERDAIARGEMEPLVVNSVDLSTTVDEHRRAARYDRSIPGARLAGGSRGMSWPTASTST